MSRLLTYTVLIGSLLLAGGCDTFLDVNENPSSPEEVPEHLILSGVLGGFSYNVIGSDPARVTSLWMQQTAYNGVPPTQDNYNVNESTFNAFWNITYSEILNNAKELQELADGNRNHAYAGMARVITAWSLSILTDLWNEIPYSEALQPMPEGTSTPAYDSQEQIYTEIFSLLESALEDFDQFDSGNPAYSELGKHDLLYGGDIGRWEKMTNTLLARLHMRLTNAPGHDAGIQAQAALEALSHGFTSNSDDADFQYYSGEGEENPWYQFAIEGKWDYRNQLSAQYVEMLESLDDPRLPVQARPAGAVGPGGTAGGFDPEFVEFAGHLNGEMGVGISSVSSIGTFYSSANAPLNWLSNAEARFIEAEATYIVDGADAAQKAYEEGIRASMEKLGVPESDIDLYINGRPALIEIQTEEESLVLQDIITQKYIANFLSYEVYNDWRRTGYPELEPVTHMVATPSGNIPVRVPYPATELSSNAENVAATGIDIGFGSLEIPVWWSGN